MLVLCKDLIIQLELQVSEQKQFDNTNRMMS
jgi:hypothetical protein